MAYAAAYDYKDAKPNTTFPNKHYKVIMYVQDTEDRLINLDRIAIIRLIEDRKSFKLVAMASEMEQHILGVYTDAASAQAAYKKLKFKLGIL